MSRHIIGPVLDAEDKMEVIAALASVAQLTSYALYLIKTVSDIHERIEGRPAHFDRQRCQLELLESTLQLLSRNKVLTTPSVREHLGVISTRIESLNALLEKEASKRTQGRFKKYCRAWIGDKTQQRIAEIFEDIEANKLALLLSIGETHAGVSDRIYSTLTEGLSSIHERMSENRANDLKKVSSNNETRMSPDIESRFGDNRRRDRTLTIAERPKGRAHPQPPVLSQCESAHTPKPNKKTESKAENGHTYDKIKLGNNTTFAVGNWGQSQTNNVAANPSRHVYGEIHTEGAAKGIVGDVYHVESAKEIISGMKDTEGKK